VTTKRRILLSKDLNCGSDTFKNFSPFFVCFNNLLLKMIINYSAFALSKLEMLKDVEGYFSDPECKGSVYARL
jgi:hypothetical protein